LATLPQLNCVLAYISASSVLPGCGGGQESYLNESPQWKGFRFAAVILTPMPVAGRGNVQQNVISEIQWFCGIP